MSQDFSSKMTRRLALGAVGLAALGAGAWWALRRQQGKVEAEANSPELASLWTQRFDTPAGGSLALAEFRGKPLVLNFWATWCAPCVREMPQFDRFHREYGPRGWQVVGLAIDGPTPVREFLARTPVGYPVGLAGFGGTELSAALGDKTGVLPFTVMIDARGQLREAHAGETSFDQLKRWAEAGA